MSTLLRAARLLPDARSELVSDGAVLFQGDKILRVGIYADVKSHAPAGTTEEDLGDVTLMPGMFDCHVHLGLDPHGGFVTTSTRDPDDKVMQLMETAALRLLDAGVTTARDLGFRATFSTDTRDRINRGEIPGPRLQCANAPVTVPGGHAEAWGGVAQGVEAVRKEVQKRIAEGVDLIKVMTTGGFMSAGSDPSKARYTLEELTAMAEEAHKAGIKITTHATSVEGISRAVDAGFDSIEHCAWCTPDGGTSFDAEVCAKLVQKGLFVDPTLNTACTEHSYICPWDERNAVVNNLRKMIEAGCKIITGTDSGVPLSPFERYADGVVVYKEAGMSERDILYCATQLAAEACGLSQVTGRLVEGLCADIVAVKGDPTTDIHAIMQPAAVWYRGKRHALTPVPPIADNSAVVDLFRAKLRQGAQGSNHKHA